VEVEEVVETEVAETAEPTVESTPTEGEPADSQAVSEFSGVEVPLEGDTVIRVGGKEFPASEFNTRYLDQSAVQAIQERAKANYARELEQAKQAAQYEASLQYQERLVRMQRASPAPQQTQPPQQGNQAGIEGLLKEVEEGEHKGYVRTGLIRKLVGMFQAEFDARDNMTQAMGRELDTWKTEYNQRGETVNGLNQRHVQSVWDGFMDELSSEFENDLPRETVEMLAGSFQARPGETSESLRAGIHDSVTAHVGASRTFATRRVKADQERAANAGRAGLPGAGGRATPSRGGKAPQTAEEIVEMFSEGGGSPS
jgi:hypothetical protein